jgi:hypothetical protein
MESSIPAGFFNGARLSACIAHQPPPPPPPPPPPDEPPPPDPEDDPGAVEDDEIALENELLKLDVKAVAENDPNAVPEYHEGE